jgi:hypothetical protein
MNPFVMLLKSRKFLLMLFDVGVSTIVYMVGVFNPGWIEHVRFLVMLWQPVIIAIIVGITLEDVSLNYLRAKALQAGIPLKDLQRL